MTIVSAVTIVGLPLAAFSGLIWLAVVIGQNQARSRATKWFRDLADSRGASAVDLGVYMGGHPLLPLAGQCALYLTGTDLVLELQNRQRATVPLLSIESLDSGVETIHAEGLFGMATEFAWSNVYFVVTFRDDKGLTNKLRVGGTLSASGHEWAGLLNSARYMAVQPS